MCNFVTQINKDMSRFSSIFHIIIRFRYLLVIVGGIGLLGFAGENSFMAHEEHQSTLKALDDEIKTYEKQYKDDTEQLYLLNNDVEAVERVAREKYFMKAADEDVFIIKE